MKDLVDNLQIIAQASQVYLDYYTLEYVYLFLSCYPINKFMRDSHSLSDGFIKALTLIITASRKYLYETAVPEDKIVTCFMLLSPLLFPYYDTSITHFRLNVHKKREKCENSF